MRKAFSSHWLHRNESTLTRLVVLLTAIALLFGVAAPAQETEKAPAKEATPAPEKIPAVGSAPSSPPTPAAAPGGSTASFQRVSDPQAVAIADSYLKAIGGKEVLAKIKDRTTKFMNIKSQATGDTEVEINLYMKKMADYALAIREEWDVRGFDIKGMPLAFTQIYNGEVNQGWVLMLGTVSDLDGKTLQVFVWDKYIDDFFVNWEDNGYTLTMGGQGLVSAEIMGEELPCDIVLATDFSGRQTTRYYFSKKDGLLVKKEWQDASTSPRGTVKKEQYYKEYRGLGFMDNSGLSLKFAIRLEIYQDGDLDTVRRYTNVAFNSGLSDRLFDKPEGKPFERAYPGGKAAEKPETKDVPDRTVRPMHGRKRPSIKKVTPITPVPEGDSSEDDSKGSDPKS